MPRGFRRACRRMDFSVTADTSFDEVVAGCADRAETWIDPAIARVYSQLHAQGMAHSLEVWSGGRLVGGLYGVRLGGAFFGESMFSRVSEASKLGLAVLAGILRERGFGLLDIQWVTDHLAGFGAVEVRRGVYLRILSRALARTCSFPGPGPVLEAGAPPVFTGAISTRHRQTG